MKAVNIASVHMLTLQHVLSFPTHIFFWHKLQQKEFLLIKKWPSSHSVMHPASISAQTGRA